jgi:hypothetical protein
LSSYLLFVGILLYFACCYNLDSNSLLNHFQDVDRDSEQTLR